MLGAEIVEFKSNLFAGTICKNISFKFPAIVASDIGFESLPFLIQNPLAPLL